MFPNFLFTDRSIIISINYIVESTDKAREGGESVGIDGRDL